MRDAIRDILLTVLALCAGFALGMQFMVEKAGITLPLLETISQHAAMVKAPEVRRVVELPKPNPIYMTGGPVTDLAKDFRAIVLWENRGVIRSQYNKKENARGPAQIRPGYLKDANEWLKSKGMRTYTLDDMMDYDASFAVFCAYMARYGAKTTEERARGHNGMFASKAATQGYWEGVQTYIGK